MRQPSIVSLATIMRVYRRVGNMQPPRRKSLNRQYLCGFVNRNTTKLGNVTCQWHRYKTDVCLRNILFHSLSFRFSVEFIFLSFGFPSDTGASLAVPSFLANLSFPNIFQSFEQSVSTLSSSHNFSFIMVAFGAILALVSVASSSSFAHPLHGRDHGQDDHHTRDLRIVGTSMSTMWKRQAEPGSEFRALVDGNKAFRDEAGTKELLATLTNQFQGKTPITHSSRTC